MSEILTIKALKNESCHYFEEAGIKVIYSGVGKVNAAYALMCALSRRDIAPRLVVNMGSAGSPVMPTGSLVNCTAFIQRDMDVTALGFEKYQTPFDSSPPLLRYGLRIAEIEEGVCGTGDSFATNAGVDVPYQLVDMEAYVLARICQKEDLPFVCVKYITDGADGSAADDWAMRLDDGARKLLSLYQQSIFPLKNL